MRLQYIPAPLLGLIALILASPASANPLLPLEQSSQLENLQDLDKRSNCPIPCGYYNQLCCAANQYCYTDSSGQAQCGQGATPTANAAVASTNGQWQYFTTTYVQTDLQTITTTFSSFIPATTATSTALSCTYSMGETPCGSVCCLSGQYCASSGQCVAVGGSSAYYSSFYTVTTVFTQSPSASAPLRGTSNSIVTVTSTGTGSATTTVPFQTPVGTSGVLTGASATVNKGGLSGGAIAGIVIGVILALALLVLFCICCCAKAGIDSILAIFGLGPRSRRREETTYIEERHSRRGNRGGRTWFGTRPTRASRTEVVEKRGSGWGGLAGVAAALGGLALVLGLKRNRDRKNEKSDASYSYYSSEYDETSASSESSDRRTRDSRRSRSRR